MKIKKELLVFIAHIDDFECACFGFLFKHHLEYDKIKIITATSWDSKKSIWKENLQLLPNEILKKVTDINFKFPQRQLNSQFDSLKDRFYNEINFKSTFDILTHDENDCHTDHVVLFQIAKGMYKYAEKFVTIYSPSSASFNPNYFLGLSEDTYQLKKRALDKYNIKHEQSYSELGYYLKSDDHYNIGRSYVLENCVNTNEFYYYEVYKILKWA